MKRPKDRLSIGYLYDDTLDSSDGVAQQVKTLGAWFAAQGHQVTFLAGETKADSYADQPIYSLAKNIKVVFNGNKLSMPLRADTKAINKALREFDFDVIHVQAPFSPLMASRVIGRAAPETAVVATFHIYPSSPLVTAGSKLLKLPLLRSLKRLDAVTSVSAPAAVLAKDAFGLDSKVIPNTIDVEKFAVTSGPRRNRSGYQIVFLGRLVRRKGCLELLKAFGLLTSLVPEVRLTIAGDGPQRASLERYAREHGLGEKVEFSGFIKEADKPELLAGADIACFPSLYGESFGIVLIEAMAAGSGVVIGGDNPGYRSVLGEHEILLIDPTDSQSFASRLAELLQDKALAARLHKWQSGQIKKYDVATVGPKLESVYRQAIAKRAETRHN
jgi:phosphatidylinositol alpha-mannosyltransferase